jgi:methyl-accepting chemotaxis protein
MDEVTQQNSALVEENAATAKTLEHQAKAMDEQFAFFQIAVGDEARAASVRSESHVSRAPAAPSRGPAARKAPVAAKPVPSQPAQRAAGNAGPARRMQTALATAVNVDQDWKEF